jgi:hypothetical protein
MPHETFCRRVNHRYIARRADAHSLTNVSVLGFRLIRVFPDSVGMAVGFSLSVDATFDDTRHAVEKALGHPLGKCETGEGMRNCELEVAPERTVTLLGADKSGTARQADQVLLFLREAGARFDDRLSPILKKVR